MIINDPENILLRSMYKLHSLKQFFNKMPALISVSYFHVKKILKIQMTQQLQALGSVTLHMLN